MKNTLRTILLAAFMAVAALLPAQARESYLLRDGWRFFFQSEKSSDNARTITLPHTWNLDALVEGGSYRQTTANYLRQLYIPAEWSGKRIFIKFNGVQSVADVFMNGRHAGSHKGGWTAFATEITSLVNFGAANSLRVVVSNSYRSDVLPTSVDDNLYGGIYRDVELIVTGQTAVSPLYHGTDGVMVHPHKVTAERVEGSVAVALTGKSGSNCSVSLDIIDTEGYVADSRSVRAKIDGKPVNIPFAVENPTLWSPASPALYEVRVAVGSDTVSVTTGFRDIRVTAADKLSVNGRRHALHGVTLHHDLLAKGSAVGIKEMAADLDMLQEMGANALRSAVAPHAQALYDECDRRGIVVWIDSPFTQAPYLSDIAFYNTPDMRENGLQQLREIVLQNCNHPSVAMWGIFSNLRSNAPEHLEYMRELNSLARSLDPSRPTVACSSRDGEMNFITDLIVWQQNIGWDGSSPSDLTVWQAALSTNWNHLAQAVCYGGDNTVAPLRPNPSYHSAEGRQALLHEGYAEHIDEELFWGIWLDPFFDFGSSRHNGGVNGSGLVHFDHARTKDSYHLYRALWNRNRPTLHITGKNYGLRAGERQVIRIYSSAGEPCVTLNGDTIAVHHRTRGVYATDTLSLSGHNTLRAVAGGLSDSLDLTIGNYLERKR